MAIMFHSIGITQDGYMFPLLEEESHQVYAQDECHSHDQLTANLSWIKCQTTFKSAISAFLLIKNGCQQPSNSSPFEEISTGLICYMQLVLLWKHAYILFNHRNHLLHGLFFSMTKRRIYSIPSRIRLQKGRIYSMTGSIIDEKGSKKVIPFTLHIS